MTPDLSQIPLRLLVLGALCTAPLISMATNLVSVDRSESVVHSANTWLNHAGPSVRAGPGFALQLAEGAHPMSFAYAAREHPHGPPAFAAVFSRHGDLTHDVVWSPSFLSDNFAPGPFASVTTPVPEPGTYVLMLAGLVAIGFAMRGRRRS
ncbi:MAG: PEP-CTERM sorting domain-containing protein [Rhizobacter sp.]|nr:PEP-CTERM sorting domain-containing protein [Rhizobacter sp.]